MNDGMRYIISVVIAIVITLSAFYLMHSLISDDVSAAPAQYEVPSIHFSHIELNTEIDKKPPPLPPEPEPQDLPPAPPDVVIAKIDTEMVAVDFEIPDLISKSDGIGIKVGGLSRNGIQEGDISPVQTFAPQYPADALRKNIQGYVTLQFTITETGAVHNPRVVDANPPRVFDDSARRAILRWRFKPRVINGVAVTREATQTLEFKLEGN